MNPKAYNLNLDPRAWTMNPKAYNLNLDPRA